MDDAKIDAFSMHGAREAIAGGLLHTQEQVIGIEQAVHANPGLAFDLAKTLIESACRTILSERNIGFDPADDLPKLFKNVTSTVPFLPPSSSGEVKVRKSLVQTLSGLHTALQGVCELRNECGFTSHGSDKPRPAMESAQALLAAQSADTIVGFLFRVHLKDRQRGLDKPVKYEEQEDFNTYLDEIHEVIRIFDAEFKPSEILFLIEPQTYRIYLTEYESRDGDLPTSED